jgi:putative addiction module killer protein
MATLEIRRYQTASGKIPFKDWLDGLRDERAQARIVARLDRLQDGLFGDWRSVGSGVYELRIDHGPGCRIYLGQEGKTLVLLLCGGNKRTQTSDIEKAHGYWKDHKARIPSKRPIQGGGLSQERSRNRRLH